MTLHDDPKPATPPNARSSHSRNSKLANIANVIRANPGQWYEIARQNQHNGVGVYRARLAQECPGVEVISRRDPEAGDVCIFARVPEVSP